MASEQARRENVVKEREVKVEKDKVPKMATHFESMADKSKDSDTQNHHHGEGEEETGKEERASLEDIHKYRANAQQKSMDTIRAAEERYNKAKESLSHGGQESHGEGRDSGVHVTQPHGGGGAAAVFGQEGPGRVGVELTGEGREELESGAHGFHGEKARHAQLLAAGGEEIRERKSQESVGGGGGGRSATDTVTQAKGSVGKGS